MRPRKAVNDQVAEVSRRRLQLLRAELAGLSREVGEQEAGKRRVQASGERGVERPSPGAEPAPAGGRDDRDAGAPAPPLGAASSRTVGARPGRHARRRTGLPTRIGGWLHDRLPPTMQGRVALTPSHLTVVALLVSAGVASTAWWVVRADGQPTMVPAAAHATRSSSSPSPLVALPATGEAGTSASDLAVAPSASPSTTIVVDVAGKVRDPGIVTLQVGARVVDALEAAGGARRGVDLTNLNLARLLVDGEQVVVGLPPPEGVAAPAAASVPGAASGGPPLVNLNSANQAQLEELPGVGPVTAAAILQWRAENGAFSSVDELLEISGIGEATLAEIAPFVTL